MTPDPIAWVHLALAAGFSTGRRQPLLGPESDPHIWLEMDDRALRAAGVPRAQRRRLLDPVAAERARHLVERGHASGQVPIWRTHADWPAALARLRDPPLVLWLRGRIRALGTPGVAVVGSRHATPYGLHATRSFATALALGGSSVVSGLARGIDAAAHESTLEVGGTTLAVLGSGLDRLYPAEHEGLAERIASAGGLLLTEYPPGYRAHPGTFPRRNRILAGLCRGILVVEAGRRSGALITSEWGLALGIDVWAVPGPFSSPSSEGCHRLIRDGAQLADSPESLLEDLGVSVSALEQPATSLTAALPAAALRALAEGPMPVEALATRLRTPIARLLVALQDLELRGLVECRAGGLFHCRANALRRGAP